MPVTNFTLPAQYIRQVADQIESMGGDVALWLKQVDQTAAPEGDPLQSLSYQTFHRLIESALTITNEPAFGLLVGERLQINSHGILGYAAMNSGTLRQLLDLFEKFIKVRTTLVSASHEVHGESLRIIFHEACPLGTIRGPVLETIILTIKNLLDFITMGAHHIDCVYFPFNEPDYADLAHDLFKCEVRYGQTWAGFTLPVAAIDEPLKMADPTTFNEASQICQRELDQITQPRSLSARIKRVMLEKQSGFPTLNVTARLFHLTPRTLHRRLQDEGTSYKEILESVRHMLALEHLKSDRLSIQEVAYLLGYTDLANFRRAFKRWEAVAPSTYREHNH